MEGFPRASHNLETTERAENVVGWLGLSFDDLKDKLTLDVGAGSGELASEGKKRGCEIIAIDAKPVLWFDEGIQEDIPYVVGDARSLPFKDETFDYVLSFAAPPTTWSETPELVASTLQEYMRVVKEDGEVRFGSGFSTIDGNAAELLQKWWEKLITKTPILGPKFNDYTTRKRSVEFLQSLYPDIVMVESAEKVDKLGKYRGAYFILKKSLATDYSKQNLASGA